MAYSSKAVVKITAGARSNNSSISKPLILGIWMSRKIRSGSYCWMALNPSKPSLHSWTISSSGYFCKYSFTILRASGSSSIVIILLIVIRYFNHYDKSIFFFIDLYKITPCKQKVQSSFHRIQTEACACWHLHVCVVRVHHSDHKILFDDPCS